MPRIDALPPTSRSSFSRWHLVPPWVPSLFEGGAATPPFSPSSSPLPSPLLPFPKEGNSNPIKDKALFYLKWIFFLIKKINTSLLQKIWEILKRKMFKSYKQRSLWPLGLCCVSSQCLWVYGFWIILYPASFFP